MKCQSGWFGRLSCAVVLLSAVSARAAVYELTVASGEQSLAKAFESAYSGATLSAGDTIVKKGGGVLKDDALAVAGSEGVALTFQVDAGVLKETVSRAGCTYSATSGVSTVYIGVKLSDIATNANNVVFNLKGNGAEASYPGALCFASAASSGSDQWADYHLWGDTTVYCAGTMQLRTKSSSSKANRWYMNGHRLTFKNAKLSNHVRMVYGWTLIDPGEITFDACTLTTYNGTTVRVYEQDEKTSTRVPKLILRNAARFNPASSTMSTAFTCIDASADATFRLVSTDGMRGVTALSVDDLVGAPTSMMTNEAVKVSIAKGYTARAEDLLAGNRFTSLSNDVAFAEGATVSVMDWARLLNQGVQVLVTAQNGHAITGGSVTLGTPLERAFGQVTQTETEIRVTYAHDKVAATAEELTALLPGLQDGDVVFLTGATYDFGDELDLSSLGDKTVDFNAAVESCVISSPVRFASAASRVRFSGVTFTARPAFALDDDSFVAYVQTGETNDFAAVTNGFSDAALAALSGKRLVKMGAGTLRPACDLTATDLRGVTVGDGVYYADCVGSLANGEDGKTKSLEVKAGATLAFQGIQDVFSVVGYTLTLAGSGFGDEGGAFVPLGTSCYVTINGVTWILSDDATIYSREDAAYYSKLLMKNGAFTFNGHALTLRTAGLGSGGKSARWCYAYTFNDSGTIVFDGVDMSVPDASNASVQPCRHANSAPGAYVTAVFRNGARCLAPSQKAFSLFDRYVLEDADTQFGRNSDSANPVLTDVAVGSVVGVGTVGSVVGGLTVTNVLGVKAADLAAGRCLTVPNLTLAPTCRVLLDTFEGLSPSETYAVAAVREGGAVSGEPAAGDYEADFFAVETTATGFSLAGRGVAFPTDVFEVSVPDGAVSRIADATNRLSASEVAALSGKRFVKRGGGVFRADSDFTGLGLAGITVAEGRYVASGAGTRCTGTDGSTKSLRVCTCATFENVCDFDADKMANYQVSLAGSGLRGCGAFRTTGLGQSQAYDKWSLTLPADATIVSTETSESWRQLCLQTTSLDFQGHDLVLRGRYWRLAGKYKWLSSGHIVLDGTQTTFADSTGRNSASAPDARVSLVFANGVNAFYGPTSADMYAVFDRYVFTDGGRLGVNSSTPLDEVSVRGLEGYCTFGSGFPKVRLAEALAARYDELTAGKAWQVAETLAFDHGCLFSVQGLPDGFKPPAEGITVARVPRGGLAGRPRVDPAQKSLYSLMRRQDDTYDYLMIVPKVGVVLVVR